MAPIYFDNAATTKISKRALDEYAKASEDLYLNPSASYKGAREAKDAIEGARADIKRVLGSDEKSSVIFTSSATEAIQSFLLPLLKERPGEIISTRIEHAATKEMLLSLERMGWKIKYIKAKGGYLDISSLDDLLTPDVRAVTAIHTSNANGNVQDIKGLTKIVRAYEKGIRHRILVFSDMVQSLEKVDFSLKDLDIDGASFSSHKINGPKGVGMLYLKRPESFIPFSKGGGQESGKRGGTENTPGILAFYEALKEHEENKDKKRDKVREISSYIKEGITELGATLLTGDISSPYIIAFSYKYPSEVLQRILYDRGFILSSGSACSNNAKGSSIEIYRSLGISEEDARRAVRLSLSDESTLEEAELFVKTLREI